jgi:hypothetical protein
MTDEDIKKEIVSSFKLRTGFKNLVGSVEKVLDELFPDIQKTIGNKNVRNDIQK